MQDVPALVNPGVQKPYLSGVAAKAPAMVSGKQEGEEKADTATFIRCQQLQQPGGICDGRGLSNSAQKIEPACTCGKECEPCFRTIAERQGKKAFEGARYLRHGQVEFGQGAHLTGYGESSIP